MHLKSLLFARKTNKSEKVTLEEGVSCTDSEAESSLEVKFNDFQPYNGDVALLYCLHILNVSFIGFIDLYALILYVLEKLYACAIFF